MRITKLILAALATTLTAAAHAECNFAQIAELPVTMVDMKPLVPVAINGKPAQFVLDSGGFFSVISPGLATELGLKLHAAPGFMQIRGIGGSAAASVATVKSFTLAGVDLPNMDFIVGGSEIGTGGVVGENILHIADVEYDLPHGAVRMFAPHGCDGKTLAYWARGGALSQLSIEGVRIGKPHIIAMVSVNGHDVQAMFDTGAGASSLTLNAAARMGITPSSPGVVPGPSARGFGGKMARTWIAPIASIRIGNEEVRNTHFRILDNDGLAEMLIGADFFLSHRILVSNSQQRMWFTYTGGSFFDTQRGAGRVVDESGKAVVLKDDTAAPTDAEGFSRRGMASLGRNDVAAALADLDHAVALAPTSAVYLAQRASVQQRAGHRAAALADFDKALAIDPKNVDALMDRAELRIASGAAKAATEDLVTASGLLDKVAERRYWIGELFLSADQPALAISELDPWIANHPDDSRRWPALESRCFARGLLGRELPLALADCNAAARGITNKARLLGDRGLVRLRMGDYTAALADYAAALAIDPKLQWAIYGRGLAKLKTGDKVGGEADIAAVKAMAPRLVERAAKYGLVP